MTLVIFDCDGVLVDSEMLYARISAEQFTESGYPIDTELAIARFTGISTPDMLAIVEAESGLVMPVDFTERCRAKANTVFDSELQAIAGISDVLAGHAPRRCVASSSSPARIRRSLKSTGLYGHFADERIFSAAMVERGKPAPDLFLHAAATMGSAPAECVVIEDSLPGAEAGVAAGMTVFGFTGGSHIRDGHADRLRETGVDRVFGDMTELPALLDAVAAG